MSNPDTDNPTDLLKKLLRQASRQADNAELEGFEQGYQAALTIAQLVSEIPEPDPAAVWAYTVAQRRRNLVDPLAG